MNPERPIVEVDLRSPVPVYRQIADAIRAALVDGRFRVGDQLPPARDLATDLAVNHNTVVQGYRILADEGWIELGRRRGATVRARPAPRGSESALATFEKRLVELIAQAIAHGARPEQVRRVLADASTRPIAQEE